MSSPAIAHLINENITPWQQVEEEFSCDHPETEIRYKVNVLGRKNFVKQCLTCGNPVTSSLKHSTIRNPGDAPPFDTQLQENYQAAKRRRRDEISQVYYPLRNKVLKADYDTYLKSPEWQRKRVKVLERDSYLCQACLSRKATDAHHLTYKHFKNEPLFELISVCRPCHEKIHNIERSEGLWTA